MVTPVLIPNTAVKHCSGDDTLMGKVASRQNQAFKKRKNSQNNCGFFLLHLMLIYTHMSWGTQRRNRILSIIVILLVAPILIWFFVFNYEAPTCFDGKKNGSEGGVDCGGGCVLLCQNQSIPPYVKWTRFFRVAPGVYNAMAYVENQNASAETMITYRFILIDAEGAKVAEREGSAKLPAKMAVPIAANIMNTGKITPTRVTFEITNTPVWKRSTQQEPIIVVSEETMSESSDQTTIFARVTNISFGEVKNVSVVAILYDRDDNSIGVSSTYVEKVPANDSKKILFTWPRGFDGAVARFEVIPLYENI